MRGLTRNWNELTEKWFKKKEKKKRRGKYFFTISHLSNFLLPVCGSRFSLLGIFLSAETTRGTDHWSDPEVLLASTGSKETSFGPKRAPRFASSFDPRPLSLRFLLPYRDFSTRKHPPELLRERNSEAEKPSFPLTLPKPLKYYLKRSRFLLLYFFFFSQFPFSCTYLSILEDFHPTFFFLSRVVLLTPRERKLFGKIYLTFRVKWKCPNHQNRFICMDVQELRISKKFAERRRFRMQKKFEKEGSILKHG